MERILVYPKKKGTQFEDNWNSLSDICSVQKTCIQAGGIALLEAMRRVFACVYELRFLLLLLHLLSPFCLRNEDKRGFDPVQKTGDLVRAVRNLCDGSTGMSRHSPVPLQPCWEPPLRK